MHLFGYGDAGDHCGDYPRILEQESNHFAHIIVRIRK